MIEEETLGGGDSDERDTEQDAEDRAKNRERVAEFMTRLDGNIKQKRDT